MCIADRDLVQQAGSHTGHYLQNDSDRTILRYSSTVGLKLNVGHWRRHDNGMFATGRYDDGSACCVVYRSALRIATGASATRCYHAFIAYASTSAEESTKILRLAGEHFPNTNKIIEQASISNRR